MMSPVIWAFSPLSQKAARAPSITFSSVTQTGRKQEGWKQKGFLPMHLVFTEVGKSFPQSPNHLSLPSSWPKLDHMAIASCRGGCESKYLGFSVPIVGSWQGKSGLGIAMGSHPIVSCFGNFVLMK